MEYEINIKTFTAFPDLTYIFWNVEYTSVQWFTPTSQEW